jgi:hypothetical protein
MRDDKDISVFNDVTNNLKELIGAEAIKRGIKYLIHNQQVCIGGVFDSRYLTPGEE